MKALIVAVAFFVFPVAQAQNKPSDKRIYCWDDNGQRVCGDALPASVVGQQRDEISARTGRTRQTIERTKTPQEMQEEQLQAQIVLQQQQQLQEQTRQEEQLLITYPREADLTQAFQQQEENIHKTISSSELSLKDSRKSVLEVLQRLANFELEQKPIPERQLAILKERRDQVVSQEQDIARQQQQLVQLRTQHAQALSLYRTLKERNQSN